MPELILLEMFESRPSKVDKKVAELDITRWVYDDLEPIIEIQDMLGRSCKVTRTGKERRE